MPKAEKARKRAAASLPKRAPKRTGRKGIGPAPERGEQPEAAKKPRQARLPQMEDPQIEELEVKAEEYYDVLRQRLLLTPQEVQLKGELLALMEKHGKESYVHSGIDIKVVVESKKVRVKIKKEE